MWCHDARSAGGPWCVCVTNVVWAGMPVCVVIGLRIFVYACVVRCVAGVCATMCVCMLWWCTGVVHGCVTC